MDTRTTDSRSQRLTQALQQRLQNQQQRTFRITVDPAQRHSPFPLADMQYAYWVGRQDTFSHAGAIQFYVQLHTRNLDLPRLTHAWNRLLQRHDMLRAVVNAEGVQRVLQDAPWQDIETSDVSTLSEAALHDHLAATQSQLQAECASLASWPHARLIYDQLNAAEGYLHIKLDLWCIDGRSLHIVFDELAQLYQQPDCTLPPLQMQFRDYIMALQQYEQQDGWQHALQWWQQRMPTLPSAPDLPRHPNAEHRSEQFIRLEQALGDAASRQLQQLTQSHGLSLAGVLLSVYAHVLAHWSSSRHFTLNIPRFNRPDWHPDIGNVVGEFASFSLLEVDLREPGSFIHHARTIQQQLWQDLDHQAVSGVRQLRELARARHSGELASMPYVFTTTPDLRQGAHYTPRAISSVFGEVRQMVSRTPQVLIDCQYLLEDGSLHLNWDAMPGAFPDGMLDTLFATFVHHLRQLAASPEQWHQPLRTLLPDDQHRRRQPPATLPAVRPETAAQGLRHWSQRTPAAPALICADGPHWNYRQLEQQVAAWVRQLQAHGLNTRSRVALLLPRGWQQTVALLACQWLGCTSAPLDHTQPTARLQGMLNTLTPDLVLSLPGQHPETLPCPLLLMPEPLPAPATLPQVAAWDPDHNAVIIFTSGSTGTPKGVQLHAAALANALQYSAHRFGLSEQDGFIAITALHHDMMLFDQLLPFQLGARLVQPLAAQALDPAHWLQLVQEHGITVWNSVPRFLEWLLQHSPALPDSLRTLLLGGDWLPPAKLAPLLAQGRAVYSVGGPTETTLWNIVHPLSLDDCHRTRIPYGRAIDHCQYHVLNDWLEDCPDGVSGELYCSGMSLAQGYLNAPEHNAARFLPHPLTGIRLYRTGDKGYCDEQGIIHILGRTDFMLNAGGLRINPHEIESALLQHPAIAQAVVLEQADAQQRQHIVAAVLLRPEQKADEADWIAHCRQQVPAAAIPRRFVVLTEWPVNANGKLDRPTLSRLMQTQAVVQQASRPLSPEEQSLADIWQALLPHSITRPDAHFFAMGGDSLLATRLLLSLEQHYGFRPPLGMVFSHPVLQDMCQWLSRQPARQRTPWPSAHPETPERGWAEDRIWFMNQLSPGHAFFNLCHQLTLDGDLNPERLAEAFRLLVARHEPLRAHYPRGLQGHRYQIQPATAFPLPCTDLQQLAPEAQAEACQQALDTELTSGFDLENGPILRAHLLQLGPQRWQLLYSLHHIAFDGWSSELFVKELFQLYGTGSADKMPVVARYADFTLWQQQHYGGTTLQHSLTQWQAILGEASPLSLPSDHPRSPVQSFRGASLHHWLDAEQTAAVQQLAQAEGVTPFMVLLAAMQLTLGRLAGQDDFIMGSVLSGRDHAATQNMIGLFINPVPLRARLQPDHTFRQLLLQTREAFLASEAHQHVPLQALVQQQDRAPDLSRNPLYQVSFTYQAAGLVQGDWHGLQVRSHPVASTATHMDLEILALPDQERLLVVWQYAADLFSPARIEQWQQAFTHVLQAALDTPDAAQGRLPLAPLASRLAWSRFDGGPALPGLDPWPKLAEHAAQQPDALALFDDHGARWSWQQLMTRAEYRAGQLLQQCPQAQRIAVRLHPGFDYACTILAILRLGLTWLPIDPQRPITAVQDMLQRAEVDLLVSTHSLWPATDATTPSWLLDQHTPVSQALPPYQAAPGHRVAWVQHTSGSSGQPKAVALSYDNLRHRLAWGQTTAPLHAGAVACLKTSPAFVDAMGELLDSLLAGMSILIPDPDAARSPYQLHTLLQRHQIDRLVLTPTLATALLAQAGTAGLPVRVLVLGGEKVQRDLAQQLLAALPEDSHLLNYYGCTEVSSDAAWSRITTPLPDEAILPAGESVPGCTLWLLDAHGAPVAPGQPGHIHVSGWNLAEGYLNEPELTAAAFHNWTHPDGHVLRLYATGDIGRRQGQQLSVLGRQDQQIKLRGMRVESGELEVALRSHPAVKDAVIQLQVTPQGDHLVAHILLRQGQTVRCADLREHLARQLSASLLPTHWSLSEQWPLTTTGKVDRRQLPQEGLLTSNHDRQHTPPRTDSERALLQLWQTLLGPAPIGIDDNFFEAGGNSLLLAQLHQQVCSRWQCELPLTQLFQQPSIRALATLLDQGHNQQPRQATRARAAARLAARRRSA
ncbi:amino acid adenylation domain-containing protein [Leeia sp.]|uniref:amino acid adenylation domain-containing protein n=1 Tax=Leeia sp. TaxID=2884678 RepID=UPI0035B4BD59